MSIAFDLLGHDLQKGYTLVEASAGTGKTYSITWLVARLLLEQELKAEELLVVTFTIAATQELDSRIRVHLNEVLAKWPRQESEQNEETLGTELWTLYQNLTVEQRQAAPARLQQALDHFDLAQISTIHGFCGQMLRDYSLESGVEANQVQTHLSPLFEEISEDFRSLVISEASRPALRLMNAISKKLKHDVESLVKICKFLEPEGWASVYCDPLLLPKQSHEAIPEHLEHLIEASKSSILPPPPAPFEDELQKDVLQDEASLNQQDKDQNSLFSEALLPTSKPCDLSPSHVVEAWSYIGDLFDYTVNIRLLPALQKEELRTSLQNELQTLNAQVKWNSGGGEGLQQMGWEAIELILDLVKQGRSTTSTILALNKDLSFLSTVGIVGKMNKITKVNKPFLDFSHPLSDILNDLSAIIDESMIAMRTWFRWGFAVYAQKELSRRKQAEGWVSTNDLVRLTHAALHRPDGQFLARVRERFGAALIDEFQDTDPMQWGIFSKCLDPQQSRAITYLIGDPKQSIYRFRGADLNAYLAVKLGIKPERAFTMSRNFRSDPRLLDALNQHFDPRQDLHQLNYGEVVKAGTPSEGSGFFLDEQVPYVHVDGGRENRAQDFSALRWRYFELDLVKTRDENLAEYVAEDVSQFLSKGYTLGTGAKKRQVALSDIGILTRTNLFAMQVSVALAKRGIASTIRGDDDVFKTTAAGQLERLVRAMLLPEDEGALRSALAVELLGFDAWDVQNYSDSLKEVFTQLHGIWINQGFAAAFHALLHDPQLQVIERALRLSDGARDLSRMIHASERIQAREGSFKLSPELTLQWLRERRLDSDIEASEEDEVRPHIDTDAVEVVTVHRSKGLEYGILFCPDLWIVGGGRKEEIRVTEPAKPGEPRSLDLRLDTSEELKKIEKEIAEASQREERRLLYVALTRAVHHCSIYLSVPSKNFHLSPLYSMIMGTAPQPKTKPKRAEYDYLVSERGAQRYINTQGELRFDIERHAPRFNIWRGASDDSQTLAVHQHELQIDQDWRISSFSSLAQLAEAKRERMLVLEELPELDEATHGKVKAPMVYSGKQPPLIDLSGSARFGQCIHALLEKLDFYQCQESDLEYLTEQVLNAWGFDKGYASRVASGLMLALNTPLASSQPPPEAGSWALNDWARYELSGFCLYNLPRSHRRDEVQFQLPLSKEQTLSAALLNRILRLDPACQGLPSLPDDLQLQGFLKGSIDLMFRVPQHGQDRYYIVDYKTHWLGDEEGSQLGHYHPQALQEIMNLHYYHLQSHLYLVVLHRLLKQKLGQTYQAERHLGGSYYLFLRGMAGPVSRIKQGAVDQGSAGVYLHRPMHLVTELLSLALSKPQAAEQKLKELGF